MNIYIRYTRGTFGSVMKPFLKRLTSLTSFVYTRKIHKRGKCLYMCIIRVVLKYYRHTTKPKHLQTKKNKLIKHIKNKF